MKTKIIQIAIAPESEEAYGSIIALTEDGKVFRRVLHGPEHERAWVEVETKDFVHRTGGLV